MACDKNRKMQNAKCSNRRAQWFVTGFFSFSLYRWISFFFFFLRVNERAFYSRSLTSMCVWSQCVLQHNILLQQVHFNIQSLLVRATYPGWGFFCSHFAQVKTNSSECFGTERNGRKKYVETKRYSWRESGKFSMADIWAIYRFVWFVCAPGSSVAHCAHAQTRCINSGSSVCLLSASTNRYMYYFVFRFLTIFSESTMHSFRWRFNSFFRSPDRCFLLSATGVCIYVS